MNSVEYNMLLSEVRVSAFKKALFGVLSLLIGFLLMYLNQTWQVGFVGLLEVLSVVYFWYCLAVALIRLIFPGMRANRLMKKRAAATPAVATPAA